MQSIFEGGSNDVIRFVASMVVVITVLIITVTIFLLVRQYLFRHNAAKNQRISQQYNDLLIDWLFSSEHDITSTCQKKTKKGKHHLFESVIALMQTFNGEFSDKLRSVFYDLNLEKYLRRKLRSRKWWVVAQGLRESRVMGYKNAIGFAENYINAPQLELRVEAQISIMSLKELDPFEFFGQLKRPFSSWARIILFQEINKWKQKPDATRWLKLSNPGVLVFALRTMALLHQKAGIEDIDPLINHSDPTVRSEIIRYAAVISDKDLWLRTAMRFKTETVAVRKQIGQTAAMMPDVPINLLINWFSWEKSTVAKLALARAMLIHGQAAGLNPEELEALDIVA